MSKMIVDETSSIDFRSNYEITYLNENGDDVLVHSSDDKEFAEEIMIKFANYIYQDLEKTEEEKRQILETLIMIDVKEDKITDTSFVNKIIQNLIESLGNE